MQVRGGVGILREDQALLIGQRRPAVDAVIEPAAQRLQLVILAGIDGRNQRQNLVQDGNVMLDVGASRATSKASMA